MSDDAPTDGQTPAPRQVCDFCDQPVTGHRFFRNLPCGHPVGSHAAPADDTAAPDPGAS